jgi:hypothetical protein
MNALILRNSEAVQLTVSVDYEQLKVGVLTEAKDVSEVTDEFTEQMAVDAVKRLRDLESTVETSRKAVKAPVLDLGRRIDSTAETALSGVAEERNRISKLLTLFAAEKKRKADEADRIRKAELERIERERVAREELERKNQAELERIAQEEKRAQEAVETAFTDEELASANASSDQASAARQATEAALATERQALANAEAEKARLQSAVTQPAAKPHGLSVKTVWRFDLLDVHALYAHSRSLVRIEPNSNAIHDVIRRGGREIPGLRIWSEDVAEVRR